MTGNPKILTPYSIRFTVRERKYVREMAKKLGIKDAAFIRSRIFDDSFRAKFSKSVTASGCDKKDLAKILALLGSSRIPNNLNQIAHAANIGVIEVTPEMLDQLEESYRMTLWMRNELIRQLGIKGE